MSYVKLAYRLFAPRKAHGQPKIKFEITDECETCRQTGKIKERLTEK